MTVKWSKRALSSLAGITEYIEQDNPIRARTFVQEIRQKSNLLEQFPNLGRAGRVVGVRELVAHKNYIIVYRVRGEDVQVIEVMHTARKFPTSF
jgi:toxin ParE1/3/4